MTEDLYPKLVLAIVKGQEEIIGPIAWQQASSVQGLTVSNSEVQFQGTDKKQIVDNLVYRFRDFFGQAAIEVCKEAAYKVSQGVNADELPQSLR